MAQFQILYPYDVGDLRPITARFAWAAYATSADTVSWPTFEAADAVRERLAAEHPHCAAGLRVRVVGDYPADLDWRTREKLRFGDGTHTPTPWANEPWYTAKHNDLFCHLSKKQVGQVAFTENDAKGAADRQTAMRPGRFLSRFFSDVLSNEEIEGWVNKVVVALQAETLKLTQDADEIEAVYLGGPESCMSRPLRQYRSSVHPVRVYAGPDLALAYTGSLTEARARCVVWPERKIYSRVYPHSGSERAKLIELLRADGYSEDGLDGARIRRIEDGERFVLPYIDGSSYVSDDGRYLVVDDSGNIDCDQTTGVSDRVNNRRCPDCGDRVEELYSIRDGSDCCYDCRSGCATYCEHSGDYYLDSGEDACVEVHGCSYSYTVSQRCADTFRGGFTYVESREEYWLLSVLFQCDACGEHFHTDERSEYGHEGLCNGCFGEIEELDDSDEDQANAHVLRRLHVLDVEAWRADLIGQIGGLEHVWAREAAWANNPGFYVTDAGGGAVRGNAWESSGHADEVCGRRGVWFDRTAAEAYARRMGYGYYAAPVVDMPDWTDAAGITFRVRCLTPRGGATFLDWAGGGVGAGFFRCEDGHAGWRDEATARAVAAHMASRYSSHRYTAVVCEPGYPPRDLDTATYAIAA